ncbi:MAG TPA: hypothetical protein PLZ11_00695 [Thauera sp.]|uniref:hypothetical protein n=1 Tax=Denitromonas sp. TaxID=2734609 RepID=UPI001848E835|nr:hypothetical protein [Burkholderiaceae bacterium]HRJ22428.1 hypothetical protein [Thauera sp.]
MEFDVEERQTPCPLGLIAATVALMTRYADPAPGQTASGPCDVHPLLAKKIASNLLFLQHHPELPAQFGQVMAQARTQWCGMVERGAGNAPLPMAHACPSMRH